VGFVQFWRGSCGDGNVNWLSLQDASNTTFSIKIVGVSTTQVALSTIINNYVCTCCHSTTF